MADPSQTPPHVPILFASGHRVFFLFTIVSAIVLMGLWLAAVNGQIALSPHWHAHEMIFGFTGAAIGGFLMAAVPNWTAQPTPKGGLVVGLFSLWLIGRLGTFGAALQENLSALALLDLAYLPAMTGLVARMIWISNNKRNRIVVAILAGLCLHKLLYHAGFEREALYGALYMVILLATLIGGRVVPLFTQNALFQKHLKQIPCTTPAWTHPALMVLILLAVVFEYVDPGDQIAGVIAALTSAVFLIRMRNWHSLDSFFDPIVWILHAAYIWLPLGFALKALGLLTDVMTLTTTLHALSVGAIGLLIVAIASRAALGHSGRALKVSKITSTAYGVLLSATFVRLLWDSEIGIYLSGALWIFGFALLAFVYGPILWRARIDGQPG